MNDDQRWIAIPPAELAAAILPWFASQTPEDEGFTTKKIVDWLTTGSDRPRGFLGNTWRPSQAFEKPDVRAVVEAIPVLEHACLLVRSFGSDHTYVGLTRLGMHALATNAVPQRLGLSDATRSPNPSGSTSQPPASIRGRRGM
jgi:hypothetical protein